MTIVESVKEFLIRKCPLLENLHNINVDFLPDNPDTYSIEEVPVQTVLKSYLDGTSERQFVFVFASRMTYSEEIKNNIENSGFYEKFAEWLEECTENEIFPIMEGGCIPSKIEAMSNGYLFGIDGNMKKARYQIQCRLIYDKN